MRVTISSTVKGKRVSAYGVTDELGRVQLKAPPGAHTLRVRPPRETVRVEASREIEIVAGKDLSQDVTVPLGGQLVARAMDAATGKAIPGVGFSITRNRQTYGLTSVPHYVDHPKTDAQGELRALLPAGKHSIGVGFGGLPEGYRHDRQTQTIPIEAGKTTTATFRLKKR